MAFNRNDNPLNGVRVEVSETPCSKKEHYVDMLIWGACSKCNQTFGFAIEDELVFTRAEKIKQSLI